MHINTKMDDPGSKRTILFTLIFMYKSRRFKPTFFGTKADDFGTKRTIKEKDQLTTWLSFNKGEGGIWVSVSSGQR